MGTVRADTSFIIIIKVSCTIACEKGFVVNYRLTKIAPGNISVSKTYANMEAEGFFVNTE